MNFIKLTVRTLATEKGLDVDECVEYWGERAGIHEYVGGMKRAEAEGAALADVRVWMAIKAKAKVDVDEG